ncbi:MAG: hypothetical protein K9K37_08220 [Desulfocapsa sp.]|nr:hypothetical protein [Desulfocapsa sp.]
MLRSELLTSGKFECHEHIGAGADIAAIYCTKDRHPREGGDPVILSDAVGFPETTQAGKGTRMILNVPRQGFEAEKS